MKRNQRYSNRHYVYYGVRACVCVLVGVRMCVYVRACSICHESSLIKIIPPPPSIEMMDILWLMVRRFPYHYEMFSDSLNISRNLIRRFLWNATLWLTDRCLNDKRIIFPRTTSSIAKDPDECSDSWNDLVIMDLFWIPEQGKITGSWCILIVCTSVRCDAGWVMNGHTLSRVSTRARAHTPTQSEIYHRLITNYVFRPMMNSLDV